MDIKIIGAGIGGLTLAIALKNINIRSKIYESKAELSPEGAGITLASNGMQVYKRMGLYESILENSRPIHSIQIANQQLKPISTVDLSRFEKKYGVKQVAIHRTLLHKVLQTQIPKEDLILNKKLTTIEQKPTTSILKFEDGTQENAEVLFGADGINSIVRQNLYQNTKLRSAKQICWRGIVKISIPQKYHNQLTECWGKGKRFGFVQISQDKIYWFAVANLKSENLSEDNDRQVVELFDEFHPLIPEIIRATPTNKIITSALKDLVSLKNWYSKKICLLGDAAHATTPNLGQGACQAIEDAMVLCELLSSQKSPEKAFSLFQSLRQQKAYKVVNTSWSIGKMAHFENPIGIWLRNFFIKNIPKGIAMKQNEYFYSLNF